MHLAKPLLRLALAALLACGLFAHPAAAQPGETYKPSSKKPSGGRPETPKAGEDAQKQKLREEGRGLFGGGAGAGAGKGGASGGGAPADAGPSAWTIIIYAFRGDEELQAPDALRRAQTEAGFKGAFLEKRGPATVIAYGRYGSPEEAQKDLDRIHETEVTIQGEDGKPIRGKPFRDAFLSPPQDIKGSLPEYDLRNAKRLKGDWVLYTLQVGVYSREDKAPTQKELEEFRKAAEQAVVQLRREGEQAYYYHGPMRSSVTIGLFGKEDYDPKSHLECAALRQLRKKFPYNLQNGAGVKRTLIVTDPKTGKQIRQQRLDASGLVAVPNE
jgi:hypothetical protein